MANVRVSHMGLREIDKLVSYKILVISCVVLLASKSWSPDLQDHATSTIVDLSRSNNMRLWAFTGVL
jgi:hypothetical protein